jgi:ribosomal protein S18 acetylase RimI-like enzyme
MMGRTSSPKTIVLSAPLRPPARAFAALNSRYSSGCLRRHGWNDLNICSRAADAVAMWFAPSEPASEGHDMPANSAKIRRAGPEDADTVQRISADAYIPAYMAVLGTIPKPATEDYRPRIENGEVWILEIKGEPTGIAVLEANADHLLIYSIAVTPRAQRKGRGRALLDFADERAIELGLHEIRLYTNKRMERTLTLYRQHGFAEIGTRPHPSRPGQVLVDMVRKL